MYAWSPRILCSQNIFKSTSEQFTRYPSKTNINVSQCLIAAQLEWPTDELYQVTTVNLDDCISTPRAVQRFMTVHGDLTPEQFLPLFQIYQRIKLIYFCYTRLICAIFINNSPLHIPILGTIWPCANEWIVLNRIVLNSNTWNHFTVRKQMINNK